jgi:glycosyltransferase involved in cell wall biosynthesis
MAKWLAARGHDVTVVTWDEGQRDGTVVDGVRVRVACRRDAGLPGLRFLHPRWSGLCRALRRADADVYYQNCGEYVTGQVALWCRWHGRPFVYSVAADADCDRRLPLMRTLRERVLYRHGLRSARRVIVQTRTQQRLLGDGFGVSAVVEPMPCPEADGRCTPPGESRARVLWLGRICDVKRPEWFLELARACPEFAFDLVGPFGGEGIDERVREGARRLPNLAVHGAADRAQVGRFYRSASVLCCTSEREGFPNTFLEAWSHGLPVVTTFDPDGLVAEHGLGTVASDVPGLVAGLRALLTDAPRWQESSRRARSHFVENHAVDRAMPRFEGLLRALAS